MLSNMSWKSNVECAPPNVRAGWAKTFLVLCSVFPVPCSLLVGCAQVNNPWIDSSVAINDDMRTPSSDAYSKKEQAELRLEHARTWPGSIGTYHNGAVTHWPLWFEDPFEDKGNAYCASADRDAPDNQFTWNGV